MASFLDNLTKTVRTSAAALVSAPGSEEIGAVYSLNNRTYINRKLLGSGGYAFVYLVESESNPGQFFALKRILVNHERMDNAKREVAIWNALPRHPNLVNLIAHGFGRIPTSRNPSDGVLLLLMPLCSRGSLYDEIVNRYPGKNYFTERQVLKIFEDVCAGVAVLHSKRPRVIIHRDLKVENVLFDSQFGAQICDFGSATTRIIKPAEVRDKSLIEEEIQAATTLVYRSPECIEFWNEYDITEKMDIWALGCVLYKMMYFEDAFAEGALAIVNCKPAPPPTVRHFSPDLCQLYTWAWTENPSKRPDIFQLLARIGELRGSPTPIDAIKERYARLHGCTTSIEAYYASDSSSSSSSSSSTTPSGSASFAPASSTKSALALGLFDGGATSSPSKAPSAASSPFRAAHSPAPAASPSPSPSFFSTPSAPQSPSIDNGFFSTPSATDFFATPAVIAPANPTFDVASTGDDFFGAFTGATNTTTAPLTSVKSLTKNSFANIASVLSRGYLDTVPLLSNAFYARLVTESWQLWHRKPRPSVPTSPLSESLAQLQSTLLRPEMAQDELQATRILSGLHFVLLTASPFVLDKAFSDSWATVLEQIGQKWARSATSLSPVLSKYCAYLSAKLSFLRQFRQLHGGYSPRSFSPFGGNNMQELYEALTQAIKLQQSFPTHHPSVLAEPLLLEATALLLVIVRLFSRSGALLPDSQRPDLSQLTALAAAAEGCHQNFKQALSSLSDNSSLARQLLTDELFATGLRFNPLQLRSFADADLPQLPSPDSLFGGSSPQTFSAPAPASPSFSLSASPSPTFSPAFSSPSPALSNFPTPPSPSPLSPPPGADLLVLSTNSPKPLDEADFLSIPTLPAPQQPQFPTAFPTAYSAVGYGQPMHFQMAPQWTTTPHFTTFPQSTIQPKGPYGF